MYSRKGNKPTVVTMMVVAAVVWCLGTSISAACSTIYHAHQFDSRKGSVCVEEGKAPDGDSIGAAKAGDWIMFKRIAFNPESDTFMGFVAAKEAGNKIEIRLDAPDGPMIGALTVASTGDLDLWREQYAEISSTDGVHNVFLVFPTGPVGLDWFVFAKNTSDNETEAEMAERMAWWKKARFGMFIHWGCSAYLEGHYENPKTSKHTKRDVRIMKAAKLSNAEYEEVAAKKFNPTEFDAKEWVGIAKSAEQKYMVLTSKHHDGFCMFDTRVTDYSVMAFGPYKGPDPFQALSEECRRQGIRFGAYYSIVDYHHEAFTDWGREPEQPAERNTAIYIGGMREQIRELIENYDIAVLWMDGPGQTSFWTQEEGKALYKFARMLQPGIIINNRNRRGDFASAERKIPNESKGVYWETCMPMNENWGYARDDDNWKSTESLIEGLTKIVRNGGNLLLNVGPDPLGKIPQPSVKTLKEMGEWIRANGYPEE